MKNSFRTNLVGKCIKIFLNKQFSHNIFEHAVPKRRLFIMSPYLAITSLYLRTHLQRSINSNISFCKIKIIFKSSTRLANFLRSKDKMPLCSPSYIVQKCMCGRCNATWYCKTCCYFKVGVGEHSGISALMVQIKKINSC